MGNSIKSLRKHAYSNVLKELEGKPLETDSVSPKSHPRHLARKRTAQRRHQIYHQRQYYTLIKKMKIFK